MNYRLTLTLFLSAIASIAQAQTHSASGHSHSATPAAGHGSHQHHAPASSSAGKASEEWVEGEVRRVDRDQGKLTLRHDEIRSLDMPPMTMVFEVAVPAQMEGLSPGDRVQFQVVAEGGRHRITALRRR